MTISVIIPAYNEEAYLPKTLASLKSQVRKPDEIIIVNASSTDHTREVAKSLGVRVITVEKRTIGFSRQQGLLAARGEIVAFTDADAILPSDWLARIEYKLKQPKVVGYFGGFRVPDGPWWYKLYINIIQPATMLIIYWWIFSIPMATGQHMAFYKRAALAAGGFPVDFKMMEDIEIARRLMKKAKIIFNPYDYVLASGRRGREGFGKLISRISKAFLYYFVFRKADRVGFPDIR